MRLFSSILLYLLLQLVETSYTPANAVAAMQQEEERSLQRLGVWPLGFYEIRPDDHKCPSPYCGGVFLRPIDGSLMACPGATEPTAECYVGALDEPPTTDDTGITIIYGRFVQGSYPSAQDIYDFDVRDGRKAAASLQIILYYSIRRDTRKCPSPSCGGYWLNALATTKTLSCPDASAQPECYVASLNPATTIVNGSSVRGYNIKNRAYETNFPKLRDLAVLEASGSAPCANCGPTSCQVCRDDPADDCTFCGCPTVCKSTTTVCGGFAAPMVLTACIL